MVVLHPKRLRGPAIGTAAFLTAVLSLWSAAPLTRHENFDRDPSNWEGVNNRNKSFKPKTVTQDFGYSPGTSHAGGQPGEVGGRINPAAEPAWYGCRLPQASTFDNALSASGKIFVAPGPGHFLLGFFNASTLDGWRTPNTLVVRINGRGEGFHCHLEYCTRRWRAGAGVVGQIIPGERINASLIPAGRAFAWKLSYDPKANDGHGLLTFTLGDQKATCRLDPELRAEGATFTHFGLLPVLKAWDSPGEAWLDDITIGAKSFDFSADPKWEQAGNRRTYQTTNTRPRFDFGWSPTHFAGGAAAGELGGLIFRGDCREAARLAAYGDRISELRLDKPFFARGKVVMLRGVSDSTASIGFYNSVTSLHVNPSQDQSVPMGSVGINIEGPSSGGFYFYPVYRNHGDVAGACNPRAAGGPRIYPDGKAHDWVLRYDPTGAGGKGQITVSLDDQSCQLDLQPGAKSTGASFDRFGICTPWIDGNSVTAYFDDLEYTCAQP